MSEFLHTQFWRKKFVRSARSLAETGRKKKRLIALLVDAALSVVCLWASYSLLLNHLLTDLSKIWLYLLVTPVFTVLVFSYLGVYRWVVRSVNSALQILLIQGCSLVAIMLTVVMFMLPPEGLYTRAAVVNFWVLLVPATLLTRYFWKYLITTRLETSPSRAVGIFGAGVAGQRLAEMLLQSTQYEPACFIDDDTNLAGSWVSGLPVYSSVSDELKKLVDSSELSLVILALPSISPERHQAISEKLGSLGVSVQTVPTITELVAGKAALDDIRDVSATDVLGRIEVPADPELLSGCVAGKNVLVTGGGGSIGSEICRQIMRLKPTSLTILEQSEENLYGITEEITALIADRKLDTKFSAVLGSVLDIAKVEKCLSANSVQTVFHTAAYKHVPIIEDAPEEGIRTNIFGTKTVLEASEKHAVETFLLISTDKAVRPANCMGATKRVAEMVLQAKAATTSSPAIGMVRFGNVLDSSGSVIPKFRSQIKSGGPVTVTHPDITRYFMTIPEASRLVLQASSLIKGGEVFVLDMGEPVRICDLAETMIDLMGGQHKNSKLPGFIDITYSGLRPGEKMYEELFIAENRNHTSASKIFVDKDNYLTWPDLINKLKQLEDTLTSGSATVQTIRKQLFAIVNHDQSGADIASGALESAARQQ